MHARITHTCTLRRLRLLLSTDVVNRFTLWPGAPFNTLIAFDTPKNESNIDEVDFGVESC